MELDPAEVSLIPKEVMDRFYGCGSPVALAGLGSGETMLDLGSGGGIDCFIAARKVGPAGRVIGVDMTDEMLAVADRNRTAVAENLGYDIVEFRRGFLEQIPVESKTIDLITSNCVINLSPDKKAVFREMWRVLKDHGRVVVSDIVSRESVPDHLRVNPRLWGECLSGALTEEEFMTCLEQAGFHGLQILKRDFWKTVEGCTFFSVTLRGFKYEKTTGRVFRGQRAVYLGPQKAVMDEEGHLFPRNEPVEVSTDTAAKLGRPPYRGSFLILGQGKELLLVGDDCCAPGSSCC
jgi:ubiquinone/menaquinone biosynthesis C-methylase UbiE